jgi:hypothetical protein
MFGEVDIRSDDQVVCGWIYFAVDANGTSFGYVDPRPWDNHTSIGTHEGWIGGTKASDGATSTKSSLEGRGESSRKLTHAYESRSYYATRTNHGILVCHGVQASNGDLLALELTSADDNLKNDEVHTCRWFPPPTWMEHPPT